MKNKIVSPLICLILLLILVFNSSLLSNDNIPGYYEADVSPHFLSIELKTDSTFKMTDVGDMYPKRITQGIWTTLNDSIICINSNKQNFPISEFGNIINDSIKIKVVDTVNKPLKNAHLRIKYQNSKEIGAKSDSIGICVIIYKQIPIESIQIYYESNMFPYTIKPNKIFNSNMLIKFIPTENESIIENQYYLFSNDHLFSLGDKYEYYDIMSLLVFKKTNDYLKFLDLLKSNVEYFQGDANHDFFKEDLDSVESIVFINLGKLIENYFNKFTLIYNENKTTILQIHNIKNYYEGYNTNLDILINKFYRKSNESLNNIEFQKIIDNFKIILEELNSKLIQITK